MDGPQQAVFQFVPYVQEPRVLAGGEASQLYIRFSSYANSAFRYDAEKAQYVKSHFGAPHLDENTVRPSRSITCWCCSRTPKNIPAAFSRK